MATDQPNIPENTSKNFYKYFRFKHGRDPPSDVRNTLLVVTTLIVAVTFQAAINPPGGVWQDDWLYPNSCKVVTSDNNCTFRYAGTSVLYDRNKAAYNIFVFFNTTAFSAATSTILCLVLGSPFDVEVFISIFSTTIAFCASGFAVLPPNDMKAGLLLIGLLPPYIFLFIYNYRKG